MSTIKCIGCGQLKREAQRLVNPKYPLVIYGCDQFPYWCALSGLLRPSKGIEKAATECPEDIKKCIVCGTLQNLRGYAYPSIAYTCEPHYRAWSAWLDAHPEKRESFRPRSRVIGAKWIEVFREWVEEAKAG